MDTGIPVATSLMRLFLHEINFKKIDSNEGVVFISAPFEQDMRVCGNVVLEGLRARSLTHERFQVMSYLWRVEEAGWFTFLGREETLLAHGPLAVWESTIGEDVALPTISFHALCSDISKSEAMYLYRRGALYLTGLPAVDSPAFRSPPRNAWAGIQKVAIPPLHSTREHLHYS